MDEFTRRARKFSAGRTVLDGLAILFLGCSTCFWFVLHWTALVGDGPPNRDQIPEALIAAVMTLIYAFALPLLLSMLVPTTPAGQLLQKTMWRTIGFPVVIASTGLLGYYAQHLIWLWFSAQPNVHDNGLTGAYMIAAIIGFIVIPALCWVQVTPERWIREVEQAHHVKKLEIMQQGELAIIKARLLWAEQRAAVSYAKLLPAEQQEVVDTLKGLFMGMGDTQRAIVRTLGIQAEIEDSILGDSEIAQRLDYVAQQLNKPLLTVDRAPTWIDDQERESHVTTSEARQPAHVDSRLQSSKSREHSDDGRRRATTGDDAYLRAARGIFGLTPWTIKRLADRLDIGETKAKEFRDEWIERGVACQERIGRWYFTESEG